jgi:alpha-N-arabinofuranosidase
VFLGCRPYEGVSDETNIGRETFLLPVRWQDGWPAMIGPKDVVPRVAPLPKGAKWTPATEPFAWRDEFRGEKLAGEWNFLRQPREAWWKAGDGSLRIEPRKVELSSEENPSLIARRQEHSSFSASVKVDVHGVGEHVEAGLVAFQNEKHYFFLGVRRDANGGREVFLEQFAGSKEVTKPSVIASKSLPAGADQVELKIAAEEKPYSFFYREGGEWQSVAENVDGSILSTQRAGGFVGSYVGVFARVAE